MKKKQEADAALEEQLRSQAKRPNKYGTFEEVAPPPPPSVTYDGFNGERGVQSFTGRLAPEYDGDTRERYTNPYAKRLAEKSKLRPDLLQPGVPTVPVRRDGALSIKPNNLVCDENKRNCKFSGSMAEELRNPGRRSAESVPDGKMLREDLELLRGAF